MEGYAVDLGQIRKDVLLALGHTEGVTPAHPCWKCGATQPAHACDPQSKARRRLLGFAGADPYKAPRRWDDDQHDLSTSSRG